MSDANPVVAPVQTTVAQPSVTASLSASDQENAAAVAAAGVTRASQLGDFATASLDEVMARLRSVEHSVNALPLALPSDAELAELKATVAKHEEVLRYLAGMYFREMAEKMHN